jgi:hypothetical protein
MSALKADKPDTAQATSLVAGVMGRPLSDVEGETRAYCVLLIPGLCTQSLFQAWFRSADAGRA